MEETMIFAYPIDDELSLELQAPEQAAELFAIVDKNRAFIGEQMAWALRCRTVDDFRIYMQRDLQGMATERRWSWLIRYKGQAAGRIGIFVSFPEGREAELNYWIGEEFTGKGIVTRAARVITDYAFATLNLYHILIGFADINPKSGAVAERIGFKYEFTKRHGTLQDDEWRDLHFWGITAKDWTVSQNPVFEHSLGDGLSLRLSQLYEAPEQYEVVKRNFDEFIPWFAWANESYNLESEIAIAKRNLEGYANGTRLGISVWQDGVLVGSASINPDDKSRDVQVGYWLDKNMRGKGIMGRVVKALMEYCFRIRGMERFFLRAAEDNLASRALAERLGMKQEAIMREENLINGRYPNHVLYSILAREFNAKP
jgi:ribosomal-protein-serine acetyltransferase